VSQKLKKEAIIIENVQRRATRLVKEIQHLSYGDRLRNLGLPTLQYRRIRADLVETQNHPQCRQGRLPTYFQSEKQIIEVINIKYLKKNTVEQIGGNTVFHKESWTIGTHYQIK
jgi:hypothetical protein